VTAAAVVEQLDVFEQIGHDIVAPLVDPLDFRSSSAS